MKKRGLRFQLSAGFALIVFITIAVVSITANFLIHSQFRQYIIAGQQEFAESLAENLRSQYDEDKSGWNLDYVHGFGMYALEDGYVIKLYDGDHRMLWDAENHDMALCHQIMSEIEARMQQRMPDDHTEYVTVSYELKRNGETVGFTEISYYAPYYSNESDFDFLRSLNRIIFVIGILAILGVGICGVVYAGRMIRPLQETSNAAERIAAGNYHVEFMSKDIPTEIRELQESVRMMAQSLDEHEKRERKLTRDVAHELRTPLANVSSYLEAMTEGVWEPSKERLLDCMQEIERLKGIIADLEELHGLEDDTITLNREYFDLYGLTHKVVSSFETVMEQTKLTYELRGTEIYVFADERRIHQAIFNLISNAVKYTDSGDRIILETGSEEACAYLKVINHGQPIPEYDRSRIFDRFYRADGSRSRKTGGAGIGLAIVKAIIEAHDGRVSVSSDDKETCFEFLLPREKMEENCDVKEKEYRSDC